MKEKGKKSCFAIESFLAPYIDMLTVTVYTVRSSYLSFFVLYNNAVDLFSLTGFMFKNHYIR